MARPQPRAHAGDLARPPASIIKLDVDRRADALTVGQLVGRLARARRRLVTLAQRCSPSGRGWHLWIVVRPAPCTALETVALQLLLGSDPLREAYNLNRALAVDAGTVPAFWRRRWNRLYSRR